MTRHLSCSNDDTHLMLLVKSGDHQAFDQIYLKYYHMVKCFLSSLYCPGYLLNDLTQEVFTRLWNCRTKFRALSALKSYLFGIAKNVWRKKRGRLYRDRLIKHFCLSERYFSEFVTQSPFWAQGCEKDTRELIEATEESLVTLPGRIQRALRLVYFSDIPTAKAARLTGCSVGTLRCRSKLGIQRLQERLARHHFLQL